MQNCVQPKEGHSSQKKQKDDKRKNTTTLIEDELQELANAVKKFSQDKVSDLRAQQVSIATQVQDHLNKLTTNINDIKDTMEAETYGVDPNVPLVTPALVSLIKVLIQKQALEATKEASTDTTDHSVEIYFSKLFLEDIYSI